MCDVEEFIAGHQVCYSDMDLYITDSLQDMLDMDIKSEMATDLASGTDFSDALGLNFSEMPPLLDMETDTSAAWLMSTSSSSFVHNLDLYGSEAHAVMVNPNSVMPSTFSEPPAAAAKAVKDSASPNLMLNSVNVKTEHSPAPSPKREKSHLTFSPNTIKLKVKEELKKEPEMEEVSKMFLYVRKDSKSEPEAESKKIKLTSNQVAQPLLRIKSTPEVLKINNRNCSILSPGHKVVQSPIGPKTIISGNIHILGAQQSRTILANGGKGQTFLIDNSLSTRQLIKTSVPGTYTIENTVQAKYMPAGKKYTGEFPKPAYSYSCLIAMALKNSRTGSLPVSEIYNFMCQHFPYFKTAPNGWKNSVRHNLSLNKCFEKIEKPSTNGGQRKGCLWAMNPSKVDKMDEEVQKWSRKDPLAIRKAMVYPDNLEALERGEMKYSGGEADGELEGEGEGEGEELDADADLDTDVEPDGDTDMEALDDQELSEQELEVEEVVEGTGMVGGTYRLLATAPHTYLSDGSGDDASDVEVTDHNYDEIDLDLSQPVKLEFAFSDDYEESPAKRTKSNFIYTPTALTSTSHASRRKTPLVNRNYKIC